MTTLYKLTTANGKTMAGERNECQWGEGVTHVGTGKGELCGPGYIHAYLSPELAVLLNPIHAVIENPILWEGEGEIAKRDGDLKVGCVSFTTLRQLPMPMITTEQRVEFGIRCALAVCTEPGFVQWAEKWLSGEDKTAWAAEAAAEAAEAEAAEAAVRAAAIAAARAAEAEAAEAAEAWVAWAARSAAARAATAAACAAEAAGNLDLIALAKQVVGSSIEGE